MVVEPVAPACDNDAWQRADDPPIEAPHMKASVAFQSKLACSPEFALAAACALWPPGDKRVAAVNAAASRAIDWQVLLALATRQGIVGLVHDGLRRAAIALPPEAAGALAAAAHEVARKNLGQAAEAGRLRNAFEARGIPVAFLKGPALAMLAYGTIAMRPARDLDLLVPEPHVTEAAAVLEQAGYRRTEPGPGANTRQIAAWIQSRHDFAYRHGASGTVVELHWRLGDNPLLQKTPPAPASWVEVPIAAAVVLPTLAMDDLLVYLTMHGAHHGWARLKWVADLAALLAVEPARADRLLAFAEAGGVSRGARQLLLIAHLLFGTALPARFAVARSEERIVQRLARTALGVITRDGGVTDPNDRAFGWAGVSLSRFLLKPDWRFKLAQLRCALVSYDDWDLVPLPPALQPLYPILRLPLWLARRVSWTRGAGRGVIGASRPPRPWSR
jgi:hypothetical protein